MTRRIAFLGTGLMGAPMAGRLLDAGFDVTVWNRNSTKSAPLVGKGAKLAQTAAKAGENADIVITMLTDGPAVRDVLFEQGVAAVLKKGSIVIDMSSISPDFAREHSKRLEATGVNHIDAPVSGGVVGAQEGTLAIMAGGDEAVIAILADVFKPLGRLTRVGPSGAGQLAKLANQQIVAVTIGAIAEAMVLVEKGGGSRAAFRDAIRGGFCESRILELHGKRMIDRNFEPGGTSRIQLKDLNSILKTAGDLSLKLPLTETVREAFATFVEDGGGEKDHSALLLHIEKLNDAPQD
ncbi:2-hydroxy-3-oxopropionate reductase [Ochrobactrum intermedium]|uniref:2-hydroxy-3-oxopropionate reductase n=2 Tax=Brucella intermedia TaxID=94625 RepID=A0ABR6ANM9_9HYPH|nr:NAD(P)-dependent oxidoreductase [Brucella intermedia]KAB2709899.1 NAD(P)-dependent oxidoreductase [Brucella intermedia]MBA8850983.1 2-hydroxy-3-oxopropionate reductase [Brucella intermedia]NYD83686.1 2-hydroxy-3-oxopropionate reductase [Brucella intermedia]UXO85846.1 NAD(P)-dependent oxidoreductase [Brucella intermedia]WGJ09424.1 NAD(P)-dependent oxidoreductase [Brucella intermedia]